MLFQRCWTRLYRVLHDTREKSPSSRLFKVRIRNSRSGVTLTLGSSVKSGSGELHDCFLVHRISKQLSIQSTFPHHDDPVTQRE